MSNKNDGTVNNQLGHLQPPPGMSINFGQSNIASSSFIVHSNGLPNFNTPPPFPSNFVIPPPYFAPQPLPPPPPPPSETGDAENGKATAESSKKRAPGKEKERGRKKKRKKHASVEKTSNEKSLGTNLFALSEEARLREEKRKTSSKSNSPDIAGAESEIIGQEIKNAKEEGKSRRRDAEFCRLSEKDFINWDEEWGQELDEPTTSINDAKMKVKSSVEVCLVMNWDRYYCQSNNEKPLAEQIADKFEAEVHRVCQLTKKARPEVPRPASPSMHSKCKCGVASDDASSAESSNEKDDEEKENTLGSSIEQEVERKRKHPAAVSREIAFNERKQANDGPLCRCSVNASKKGVRHGFFAGETIIPKCTNHEKLYHYYLRVTPLPSNSHRNSGPLIHDEQQYHLEGFSLYLHAPLPDCFPKMPLTTFGPEYSFELLKDDDKIQIGSLREMDLFRDFLFDDVMEMVDEWRYPNTSDSENSCSIYHIAPRYVHRTKGNTFLLPLAVILAHYTCRFNASLEATIPEICDEKTQRRLQYELRDTIIINPSMHPTSLRIDRIEGHPVEGGLALKIVHMAQRPTAYTLHGRPEYQKAVRKLGRLRRMFRNRRSAPTPEEREMASRLESEIAKFDNESNQRREIAVYLPLPGYRNTGLRSDIVHHGLIFILAMHHIRYHWSLQVLEQRMGYKFKDRSLVELAFTHPSFRRNYGQNPDHARNTLANLGIRTRGQVINHDWNKQKTCRKKGLNSLQFTMSREGSRRVEQSFVNHNERLEFLGDAVVEFMTTVHLYFCFSRLQEGGLATFRTALVQNRNLAHLAGRIGLDAWMLFSHGPDLCHEADMKHAMANAFEALMAAIFLDGGIDHCDRIFSQAMFGGDQAMLDRWVNIPEHPLKAEHPKGDRHLINTITALKKLEAFEDMIGLRFEHIRLLAKAFTRRSVPLNDLTRGHNQRLEFLGDSVLQLIVSDFLYKHFPNHHEGHLSLLRTCLVSNNTLSIVCDDLSLPDYLIEPPRKSAKLQILKTKDKADLVEALMGAIYVDRGWDYCRVICRVCFFPRLKYFIRNDNWNDPKSRLQQACLALRAHGEAPIPIYKKISENGPTNTRRFEVTVSFKGERLAVGVGSTVQLAEMDAAEKALEQHSERFRLETEKGRGDRRVVKVDTQKVPPPSLLDLKLDAFPNTSIPPPPLPPSVVGHPPFIPSQPPPTVMTQTIYVPIQVPMSMPPGSSVIPGLISGLQIGSNSLAGTFSMQMIPGMAPNQQPPPSNLPRVTLKIDPIQNIRHFPS